MLVLEVNGNVKLKQAVKQGYIEINTYPAVADLSYPGSKFRRGRVQGERERKY